MNQSHLLLIVLCAAALCGCQRQSTNNVHAEEKPAPVTADTAPNLQPPSDEQNEDEGYVEAVNKLFRKAKESGETTATSATEWLSELYGGTRKQSGEIAESTWTKVQELYEQAKEKGATNAKDAREWVKEDWRRRNAWEYRAVPIPFGDPEDEVAELNELGDEGWECFWVDKQAGETTFYLKKRRESYLEQLPARDLIRLLPLLGLRGGGEAVEGP